MIEPVVGVNVFRTMFAIKIMGMIFDDVLGSDQGEGVRIPAVLQFVCSKCTLYVYFEETKVTFKIEFFLSETKRTGVATIDCLIIIPATYGLS